MSDTGANTNPFGGGVPAVDPMRALLAARTAALSGKSGPASQSSHSLHQQQQQQQQLLQQQQKSTTNPFGSSSSEGQRLAPIHASASSSSSNNSSNTSSLPSGSYSDNYSPLSSGGAGGGQHQQQANNNNNNNSSAWHSAGLQLLPNWRIDVASDECGSIPIKGEVPIFTDVEAYYRAPTGQRVQGRLAATTYQVRFTPNTTLPPLLRHLSPSFFCVPVACIRKIERLPARTPKDPGPIHAFDIICKDVRELTIGFRDEALAEKMSSHIRMVAFPTKIEFLQAFADAPKLSSGSALTPQLGWNFYNAREEIERLGVTSVRHPRSGERLYRISDLNKDYVYSPTYPQVLVFPERASDAHMSAVAAFRSKARVPALTWMHPGNKTTMWRCSQPRVGVSGKSCIQDEQMVHMIRESNVYSRDTNVPLLLADCRPQINAMANKAGGGGYEDYVGTQLTFMNIANIHVVRDAHRKMEALAMGANPTTDVNWAQTVHESGWLYHVRTVLSAALLVAEAMHRRGQPVLVHCSDGWDRTAQVCGLAQLMMDPYYRTVRGFCILIAKEWCSFGHKFNDRAGHREEASDGDISPVFLQFLDATWQLVRLFPAAFEFDGRLLLLIGHHLYTCRFGTFLCNNERERAEVNVPLLTPSLWAYVETRTELFRSPSYNPSAGDVLLPLPSAVLRHVTVWTDWFLRWAPFPSSPACMRMEKYADNVYNRAPMQAISLKPVAVGGSSSGSGGVDNSSAIGAGGGGGTPSALSPVATTPVVSTTTATTASAEAVVAVVSASVSGNTTSVAPPSIPTTPAAGAASALTSLESVVVPVTAATTPSSITPVDDIQSGLRADAAITGDIVEADGVVIAAVDDTAVTPSATEDEQETDAYRAFLAPAPEDGQVTGKLEENNNEGDD